MIHSKYGVKFFDEADDLSGGSSGASVAVPDTAEEVVSSNQGPKRTPFGDSDAMTDEQYKKEKAKALAQIGRSSGNVDVGLDGSVKDTPKSKSVTKARDNGGSQDGSQDGNQDSGGYRSRLSQDVISQLMEAYGIPDDEMDDFIDDEDACRFMGRIDRRQSKMIKAQKKSSESSQRTSHEDASKDFEKRTVRDDVDPTQREIDRSRGVESKATERPATPEEYRANLSDRTVGKLKKLGYEPEFIEVIQDVMDHLFFQDDHIRKAYSVIGEISGRQDYANRERATQESEMFVNMVDTQIADPALFGNQNSRTEAQWQNLRNVYEIVGDILSRRSDKKLTRHIITRAVSLAFDGNVRTRDQKLRSQSGSRMGSSASSTIGRAPGNPELFKGDRSKNPIVAQKIAEIQRKLREDE